MSVLSWISEQYAARLDQVARWVRRSPRTAQRYLQDLTEQNLATARPRLHGEASWVWWTERGARFAGCGFRSWRPRLGRLAHVGAVNEVRLRLREEVPEAVWICERALARCVEDGEPRPDGVLLDSEREFAVEVELVSKSKSRLSTRLDALAHRYDEVVYFCGPATLTQLARMRGSGRWPGLEVRPVPQDSNQVNGQTHRG